MLRMICAVIVALLIVKALTKFWRQILIVLVWIVSIYLGLCACVLVFYLCMGLLVETIDVLNHPLKGTLLGYAATLLSFTLFFVLGIAIWLQRSIHWIGSPNPYGHYRLVSPSGAVFGYAPYLWTAKAMKRWKNRNWRKHSLPEINLAIQRVDPELQSIDQMWDISKESIYTPF